MQHKRSLCLLFLYLYFLAPPTAWGQAQLVLNGAKINLSNGGKLVLENGSPSALVRHSGHIISEGETNEVHWKIGPNTGAYLVPWGLGSEAYLPLSFTKNEEASEGTFVLSTYSTGWKNSLQLPTGITNMNQDGQDNSAYVLDRFWQINTQDYLRSPTLMNVSFGYLDQEHSGSDNTIIEPSLQAQRWNKVLQTWEDYVPQGLADFTSNSVTLESISSEEMHAWWTMVDASSPLPLHFLSFKVFYKQEKVLLAWQTTDEVDVEEYAIQRSTDLTQFITINRQNAKGGTGIHSYSGTDQPGSPGVTYYRIQSTDVDGKVTYSAVKAIVVPSPHAISVFPNPIQDQKKSLNIAQIPPGNYTIAIMDSNGKMLQSEVRECSKNIEPVFLTRTLPSGLYFIKIYGAAFQKVEKLIID